ncbi:MAG TPA: 2-octaprenyl-6-methoxyphenyl hydroxylase [Rhodanobacteraceae bacterium]|nr:2-octaprenyl-6-methoxyphenyl hydroxylase [Rhodanobacteraceae bacterium]
MREHADILIVGGGLVGASLAIALDAAGRGATLVEAAAPRAPMLPSYDERNLALARATINALANLGVWKHTQGATPITHLHVSRAGEFGAARVSAHEAGVESLGATLPARELGQALELRLQECRCVTRLTPAKLERLEFLKHVQTGSPGSGLRRDDAKKDGWRATLCINGETRELETKLLVGADGTASFVRAQAGIAADEHDYAQSLIVTTITPERDPDGRAFERFSDDGPVALLPLSGRRCGLVLAVPHDQTDAVLALSDADFAALAQRRFGWKLGRLTRAGKRQAHHARRVLAQSLIAPRAALIGNAAQTVHPIGAQGFNLGLRDALTLAELVADADDPGASELLREYAARRVPDRNGVLAFSHGLISLACLSQPAFGPLRSLALIAFDSVPPLKRLLAKRGMGWRGVAPPNLTLERGP